MSLTLLKRPQGRILNSGDSGGNVTSSGGDALFTTQAVHGMSTGDFVYLRTSVKDYNGFWYVTVLSGTTFKIKEYSGGSHVQYISNPSGTIYFQNTIITHGWSCVHYPIVYKLSSSKWPTNTEDTARTVSSFTNDNGYVNLNLSGNLKGTVYELEWVKISGSNGLDGIYQIIAWYSDSDVTINLEYSAGYSFAGGTVQFYYNNFHAVVRIYGGLNSAHYWGGQKAYELLDEIKIVPDSDGVITVNIAETLKKKIEIISNNLQLATLPNNIDAFCMFYIEYAESYDSANGYTIGTTTSSYTSDQANFEGYAVNAKLPFKNRFAGFLSEYVAARSLDNVNAAKFLTSFEEPSYFPGKYFDLSWIRDETIIGGAYGTSVSLIVRTYLNSVLQNNFETVIPDNDEGVYRSRIEVEENAGDEIEAYIVDRDSSAIIRPGYSWTNDPDGLTNYDSKTATQFTKAVTSATSSCGAYQTAEIPDEESIVVILIVEISGTWATTSDGIVISMKLTSADGSTVTSVDPTPSSEKTFAQNGTYTIYYKLNNTNGAAGRLYVSIFEFITSGTANVVITIPTGSIIFYTDLSLLTERKIIKIDNSCYSEYIYLSWLNPYGGYDYWLFTGAKEIGTDILNVSETKKNIISDFPNSIGEYADTIRHETSRESRRTYLVRSQPLTKAQALAISEIKSSPLVQIVTDAEGWDRRTVTVDQDSWVILDEENKMHTISFTVSLTDDQPAQSQ